MSGRDLRTRLKQNIPEDLLELLPRAFDILGSREKALAIIEIPEELKVYEGTIAETMMEVHKNVRTILAKTSARYGTYRIRDLRLIAGEEETEVLHREAGCLLKLDPRKVYFSPREATERMRIAEMVTPGESVLVMFSGIGPLPVVIAKRQPDVRIVAVEINPVAHNYCVHNIALNRMSNRIKPILGDVREVCPRLGEDFDRVLMPLPKGATDYLDVAIPCLRSGGILHFYHWAHERDLFSKAEELIRATAEELNRGVEVLNRVRVLPYGPRMWKVRVDARIGER
ncbi:MAG: class I SAM-dependent methyltransferase family protein [Candidatus Bathyarchaeia archaeon]